MANKKDAGIVNNSPNQRVNRILIRAISTSWKFQILKQLYSALLLFFFPEKQHDILHRVLLCLESIDVGINQNLDSHSTSDT